MLKTISLQQAPSLETIEKDLFNILSHDELDEDVITHVLTLLDQHPPLITALDTHHRTLLHIAAKKGHLQIITALHQASANIQATDHSHKTPLHMAAETGQLDSIIYLVETAGANVQATPNHGDMGLNWSSMWRVLGDMQSILTGISMTQGKTPFHIAVEEGHIATAKYFVDTTEVNLHTLNQTHKNNLLIDTTKKGYLTFVKALLQAGADANTIIAMTI